MSIRIPLIKPYMSNAIKQRVVDVLDHGQLTEGLVTKELEEVFCKYIGVEHAVAVTSCTTGLELAIRALQLESGDEVIVPDYTYPATAMAVCNAGAVPVIVDVDPKTQLISEQAVKDALSNRTRVIMPVSIFGNPLDYTWLNVLKEQHNLFIIEDAACSLGAEWKRQKVGTFADISVFSLHPRKFITTGEGGFLTTNDSTLASRLRYLKRFGIIHTEAAREGMEFAFTGSNAKLSNVQAAIGLGQMQDIDLLMQRRQNQAKIYMDLLQNVPNIELPSITQNGLHAWQTFYVLVNGRDHVLLQMRKKGIEAQIGTYSMHMHQAFKRAPYILHGTFAGSRHCYENTLALPIYHDLTQDEQKHVVQVLLLSL